ncbi:MAG: CPBP family intramembrane metalloprotease [Rhodobacteraceae bacterium]|nr:CPBP family intramembrane metalloprotease [Paracoccaceae bacterium]
MIDILRADYTAQNVQIDELRATNQIWRLVLGLVAFTAVYIAASIGYFWIVLASVDATSTAQGLAEIEDGRTPSAMYALLFQFSAAWLGVAIACTLVHRRSFFALFGEIPVAVRQFFQVLAALAVLGFVLTILPPYSSDVGHVQAQALSAWAILLPVSLVAVFVQTTAEELLFRGYLQQHLAARFKSPLIWMVIPSILFAIGHHSPEIAGENAWIITAWAGVFGLLMADLTARAGSLGPAMAIHFINNLSALLLISLPDQMSGLSLFHMPFGMEDTDALSAWLPVDFGFMVVMWLTARLALRR